MQKWLKLYSCLLSFYYYIISIINKQPEESVNSRSKTEGYAVSVHTTFSRNAGLRYYRLIAFLLFPTESGIFAFLFFTI